MVHSVIDFYYKHKDFPRIPQPDDSDLQFWIDVLSWKRNLRWYIGCLTLVQRRDRRYSHGYLDLTILIYNSDWCINWKRKHDKWDFLSLDFDNGGRRRFGKLLKIFQSRVKYRNLNLVSSDTVRLDDLQNILDWGTHMLLNHIFLFFYCYFYKVDSSFVSLFPLFGSRLDFFLEKG